MKKNITKDEVSISLSGRFSLIPLPVSLCCPYTRLGVTCRMDLHNAWEQSPEPDSPHANPRHALAACFPLGKWLHSQCPVLPSVQWGQWQSLPHVCQMSHYCRTACGTVPTTDGSSGNVPYFICYLKCLHLQGKCFQNLSLKIKRIWVLSKWFGGAPNSYLKRRNPITYF